MSVLQRLLDQLQRGYNYLIGLTDQVVSNVIAAGIVALLGVVWAWLMLRLFRRKRKGKEGECFDEAFLRRQRMAMLDVVERQWIKGRLERSLHHQAPIFLGLTETPEAVERPWEVEIQTPGQAPRRTRDTGDILDVFDVCGSLLILGAPGSGKTVTLLDLTKRLIVRARDDEDASLPVVFVLASWAQEKKPLDEWMVAEMERQYRVPSALGRHWVDRREVLPLLDGLDEVEERERAACVEAINAYRAKGVGGAAVVICSRETEYAQLSTRLKVDGAVTLQPLEDQQVRQYLRRFGKKTAMLARMLVGNNQLKRLARTPLWLDVMAVAYGGDDTAIATEEVATSDIFDAYIRRVLLEHRQPVGEWSAGQCMHWLRWLAQQLERTGQMLLRLEEMQPEWLVGQLERRRYYRWLRWGTAAAVAIVLLLACRLDAGTSFLRMDLVGMAVLIIGGGLLFGLLFGHGNETHGQFIAATARLAWDWRRAWQRALRKLPTGLALGLVGLLVGNPVLGLGIGIFAVLASALIFGVQTVHEIDREMRPNQGMRQSVRNGVFAGLVSALLMGLAGLLLGMPISGLLLGLLFGLMVAGGRAALRHGLLRWRLWREGLTPQPWRYVAYLDVMASRLLLDQIGGAYRFKHDLLQKHVAGLDDEFISSLTSRH